MNRMQNAAIPRHLVNRVNPVDVLEGGLSYSGGFSKLIDRIGSGSFMNAFSLSLFKDCGDRRRRPKH